MARVIVCGYMIRHPVAGVMLAYFHYVLGLHRALEVVLTEKEEAAIKKIPTQSVRAYEYYLRGRQLFHQRGRRLSTQPRSMSCAAVVAASSHRDVSRPLKSVCRSRLESPGVGAVAGDARVPPRSAQNSPPAFGGQRAPGRRLTGPSWTCLRRAAEVSRERCAPRLETATGTLFRHR